MHNTLLYTQLWHVNTHIKIKIYFIVLIYLTYGYLEYLAGDTILAEGALVNHFCIILSGSVRVINTTYNPNSYYYEDFCMYPGSYFGEESFILKYPRSTRTFIALKDVTVCVIDSVLFNSEEILKPVVDQLVMDVARRLKVCFTPPSSYPNHTSHYFCEVCFHVSAVLCLTRQVRLPSHLPNPTTISTDY